LIALAVAGALVSSCASLNHQVARQPSESDLVNQIREVDLSPRFLTEKRVNSKNSGSDVRPITYYGESASANARAAKSDIEPSTTGSVPDTVSPKDVGKGYELNFDKAPVLAVVKAILGDILGVGYTIDPRVQGTVTLSSGRPIPRKDLIYVLESALRASNIALVRDGRTYRLVPAAEVAGTGWFDGPESLEAGYGISAVPLRYVSSQVLVKLLDGFAAKPGMVRADPGRNLVIIQGSAADRRAAIEAALNFDADWMRGQSVGLYPVMNSTPEPIISELEKIIDAGEGGLSQSLIKLQPIARQNAILAVSKRPDLLRSVSTWIGRLDQSGNAGTGVKVYRMRYGDARQVARLLNDIFVGGSGGQSDSPMNQLAPGAGAIISSSDRSKPSGTQSTPTAPSPGAEPLAASANFDGRFMGATSQTTSSMNRGGPILANVKIVADSMNNSLLIYASRDNYRIIEHSLQQLDRPQLQVAIDATIAEITLNDQLNYGVQFFLQSKDLGLPGNTGSILNTGLDTATSSVLSRVLPGFNFLVGTEATPRVILDALHAVTDVKILSTPSLVVLDNQSASLEVGDQIPITTRSAQSVDVPTAPVVNNIDYRNTGVILKVGPRVNANGNVLLDVEQEISAVSTTSTTGTLTPTITQRKVKSSIAVTSGQTVLLGGLISERQDRGRNGIPGLDQLSAIGDLFSRNSGTKQRTELIIFIRPQIIRNSVDAARVAQELRAKMKMGTDSSLSQCIFECGR
jgi:general secretion pathway protein D